MGATRQDCNSISVLPRSPCAFKPPTSCAPSATSSALLTRASKKASSQASDQALSGRKLGMATCCVLSCLANSLDRLSLPHEQSAAPDAAAGPG